MRKKQDLIKFIADQFDPDMVDERRYVPGDDPRVANRLASSLAVSGIAEQPRGESFRLTPAAAAILALAKQADASSRTEEYMSQDYDFDEEYRSCLRALSKYLETIPETCLVAINRERMKSG